MVSVPAGAQPKQPEMPHRILTAAHLECTPLNYNAYITNKHTDHAWFKATPNTSRGAFPRDPTVYPGNFLPVYPKSSSGFKAYR
jgi:hypothetical protein